MLYGTSIIRYRFTVTCLALHHNIAVIVARGNTMGPIEVGGGTRTNVCIMERGATFFKEIACAAENSRPDYFYFFFFFFEVEGIIIPTRLLRIVMYNARDDDRSNLPLDTPQKHA
jgi:hypothetical protein